MNDSWQSTILNPQTQDPSGAPIPPGPPAQKPRSNTSVFKIVSVVTVLAIVLILTFLVQPEIERQVTNALKKALIPAQAVADIQFQNVEVNIWLQKIYVPNVSVHLKSSGQTFKIGRVSVGGLDFESLKTIALTRRATLPNSLAVDLTDVEIPTEALGEDAVRFIQGIGQKRIVLSSSLAISRNPGRKTFDLEHFEVEVKHLGRLVVSASVGNLTLPSAAEIARLKKDPKLILTETGDFTKLTLRGFEIRFEDDSLVERATKALAAMGESTPISLVELAIDANTPGPAHARDVANMHAATDFTLPALETLKKFLNRPRSITLASRPKKPIPVMSVFDDQSSGSINELAHKLSLTVE